MFKAPALDWKAPDLSSAWLFNNHKDLFDIAGHNYYYYLIIILIIIIVIIIRY